MINTEIVKLLEEVKEEMLREIYTSCDEWYERYNIGIKKSVSIIDKKIAYYSMTPNDLKKELGLYHN